MDCGFDCELFNQYRVDAPYPAVVISRANPYEARLISGAYAGRGSETTAIAQYAAHRFFLAEHPDIYTAYQYIAATEMVHFNFLGHLVHALGLNPVLYSYEVNEFWNGANPDYQYTLRQILESDIQGERNAIAHYTRLIGQIGNESIQDLFRRIIMDEQKHVEVLTGFYGKYFH